MAPFRLYFTDHTSEELHLIKALLEQLFDLELPTIPMASYSRKKYYILITEHEIKIGAAVVGRDYMREWCTHSCTADELLTGLERYEQARTETRDEDVGTGSTIDWEYVNTDRMSSVPRQREISFSDIERRSLAYVQMLSDEVRYTGQSEPSTQHTDVWTNFTYLNDPYISSRARAARASESSSDATFTSADTGSTAEVESPSSDGDVSRTDATW